MEPLKIGTNDFYFKVSLWELMVEVEIGCIVEGCGESEAFMLHHDEVRQLRDWLTDYLE